MSIGKFLSMIIINKPAFFLSEKIYFLYIIKLTKLLSPLKICNSITYRYVESTTNSTFKIIELSGIEPTIRIQSHYRISRFIKGFNNAGLRQWNRYKLENLLNGEVPDMLIDIGANVGELSFFAHQFGIKSIVAMEPDPIINEILQFNLRNTSVVTDERAVGISNGTIDFYLSSETADSSVIRQSKYEKPILVNSITLKTLLSGINENLSLIIKIDAEGFEPEILKSGKDLLHKVKFFTIDISPERLGKSTLIDVREVLLKNNFEIIFESHEVITAKRID